MELMQVWILLLERGRDGAWWFGGGSDVGEGGE